MLAFLTALAILSTPLPEEVSRPGLRPYYSVWRSPNAYEGRFICKCDCLQPKRDGGYFPALAEAEDDNASACIAKLIEISKKLCPRDAKPSN